MGNGIAKKRLYLEFPSKIWVSNQLESTSPASIRLWSKCYLLENEEGKQNKRICWVCFSKFSTHNKRDSSNGLRSQESEKRIGKNMNPSIEKRLEIGKLLTKWPSAAAAAQASRF